MVNTIQNNMTQGFTLEQMQKKGAKQINSFQNEGFTLEQMQAKEIKPLQPIVSPYIAPKKGIQGILKGETTFPAKEGGITTTDPLKNIMRTAGNIPSSAIKMVAPINPFNVESPINIGANIVKSSEDLYNIVKNRGVSGVKDILGGFADTYFKIGESIYGGADKAYNALLDNPKKAIADVVESISKKGIEDPLLIPSVIYGSGKLTGGKDAISRMASPITGGRDTSLLNIAKQLTTKSEQQIESIVLKKFEKGVKPLLPGKTTSTQLKNYREDVVDAVKTINENKINLSFTDDVGQVTKGQSPKTLQQLSDAIEQTKKTIFTKYDSLAKQSGKAGLKIDSSAIGNELDTIINNEALQLSHPETINYAQAIKNRYSVLDSNGNFASYKKIDAPIVQDVIQNYNNSLSAFYRNPNYETATKAAVDSMIANKLRNSLDEGISSLTGAEYQALKNQYGSLKAIERDVIKATLRDARKNIKGLIDFADIFSGGQVVSGILTLSPSKIAQGLVSKGITEFYKYLNNPNRAIEKMFKAGEKLPYLPKNTLLQSQPKNNIPATVNMNTINNTLSQPKTLVKPKDFPKKTKSEIYQEYSTEANLIDSKKYTQKIQENLNNKMTEVNLLEENLANNPAKELSKYISKSGDFKGELKEVTGTGKSAFGKKGDDIVTEFGFKDSESARVAYEVYVKQKEKLLSLKEEIKQIKNTANLGNNKGIIKSAVDKYKSIPNKQGGFAKNPFAPKITDEVTKAVSKEIATLDFGAIKVNGKLHLGDDVDFRLMQLQDKVKVKGLSTADIQEALPLLKKKKIDIIKEINTKPLPVRKIPVQSDDIIKTKSQLIDIWNKAKGLKNKFPLNKNI